MRSEDLITALSAGLRPVRPLPRPLLLAGLWTLLAVGVIAGGVAGFGLRADIGQRLADGLEVRQLAAAGATGMLAAFAAFQLSLADRDRRWVLLPLPAAAAWVATLGWGGLQDFLRYGEDGLAIVVSWSCLGFIIGFGVLMTLLVLWLTRHAAFIRPGSVATLGGLSAAAFASIGLTLTHHLESAAMVLIWHGIACATVTAIASMAGPRMLRAAVR